MIARIRVRRSALVLLTGLAVAAAASPAFAQRAPGALDPSFHGDGRLVVYGGGDETVAGVAVQPNGKIVVAGTLGGDLFVARILPGGRDLDRAFGDNGYVVTDLGGIEHAAGLALLPAGRIAVAGTSGNVFAVVRYRSDGGMDHAFGGDGIVTTPVGSAAFAGAMAMDGGRIVVAGVTTGYRIAVVRYLPDGELDTRFSGDGIARVNSSTDRLTGMAVDGRGRVLLAADKVDSPEDCSGGGCFSYPLLVRLTAGGHLDRSFSGDGRVVELNVSSDQSFVDVAVRPAGGLVALRSVGAVDAFHGDGSRDRAFGHSGTTDLQLFDPRFDVAALTVQDDGRMLAAGTLRDADVREFGLVRLDADGSPDTSFSGDGATRAKFEREVEAADVTIQPDDGKIVVAGIADPDTATSLVALARFIG